MIAMLKSYDQLSWFRRVTNERRGKTEKAFKQTGQFFSDSTPFRHKIVRSMKNVMLAVELFFNVIEITVRYVHDPLWPPRV